MFSKQRSKIKIIADDKIPFLKGVFEPYANIEYYPGKDISHSIVKNADALIVRTRTRCNRDLLSGTKIKIVTTATIGTDHIDINYCQQNNIKWLNAPGCNSTSVMQYVASVLLTLAEISDFNLTNKTIGIVGVGNVGSKIQKVAETLGMNILLNDPPRERIEGSKEFCSFEYLVKGSDIITFHVPLNESGIDKTYHLANEEFFNQLEKKPIIVNSSRGEVIKSSALKDAIKNGTISKTVLDVWENEPDIDLELLNIVDIATPHIAGYSAEGKANGTSVCVNAINDFFNLGLKVDWYPENLPTLDSGNSIAIECKNKTDQDIIKEAVVGSYNILEDDKRFRKTPETFEKQRGEYPIRREFSHYNIQLRNYESDINNQLKMIGFNVKCD